MSTAGRGPVVARALALRDLVPVQEAVPAHVLVPKEDPSHVQDHVHHLKIQRSQTKAHLTAQSRNAKYHFVCFLLLVYHHWCHKGLSYNLFTNICKINKISFLCNDCEM